MDCFLFSFRYFFSIKMNDSEKKTTLKTPGRASQGFWYESLSPTQILTGEQNLNSNQKQRKKKKCRGNRKAQHLRRRERRRQEIMKNNDTNHMDQDIIITDDDNNDPTEDEQEQIEVIHSTKK